MDKSTPLAEMSKKTNVGRRIEEKLVKLMRALKLPHQCLTIAYLYIGKAVSKMASKTFFLSTSIVENLMITALVLAAKFYCETQDVVINADIAKLLCSLNKSTEFDLNAMEATFADLVDFDLFVSQQEYNKEAGKLNILLSKARQIELAEK